jgi:hypothetical protein
MHSEDGQMVASLPTAARVENFEAGRLVDLSLTKKIDLENALLMSWR